MISHNVHIRKIDPQDSCFRSKTLFEIQCAVSCNLHFILYSKPQGNPDSEEAQSQRLSLPLREGTSNVIRCTDIPAVSSQFAPRL